MKMDLFVMASLAFASVVIIDGTDAHAQAGQRPDYITPQAFGAKCDGIADATNGMAQAIAQAAATGRPINISGKCLVNSVTALTAIPSGFLRFQSTDNGRVLLNGNGFFSYTPTVATQGTVPASIESEGVNYVNVSATKNIGVVFALDCRQYGNFCTSQGPNHASLFQHNSFIDTGDVFDLSEVNGIHILNNEVTHFNTSTQAVFINNYGLMADGTTSACISGIYARDNTLVGGSFSLEQGCVQGSYYEHNNLLVGSWGIWRNGNITNNEQNIYVNNYFEAYNGGIIIAGGAFDQIMGNSFDRSPSGFSPTWQGINVGNATTASPGESITGNKIFGFGGVATGIPMFANLSNGGQFSDNSIIGLMNVPIGMDVGTNDTSRGANAQQGDITASGNNVWQAGTFATFSATTPAASQILARANYYILSNTLTKFEQN